MKRYKIVVNGRVQGVGFRSFCQLLALKYHLSGYAKNLDNGCVEIEVQGQPENIMQFIQHLYDPHPIRKVLDHSIKEMSVIEKEKRFGYQ